MMDSTALYGYVPTHWLSILFAVSCVASLATIIPLLRNRNVILMSLLTAGLLLQLAGHTSVAVSGFLPENIPSWAVQLVVFALGKFIARAAVFYTYYVCVRRLIKKGNIRRCLASLLGAAIILEVIGLAPKVVAISFEIFRMQSEKFMESSWIFAAIQSLAATVLILIFLVGLTVKTRKEIPWFQVSRMMGYYITLQILPVFLLTQNIYDMVRIFVPRRYEIVELLCDMGMTKTILIMVGGQCYEVAHAWSQSRPKALATIENLVRTIVDLENPPPNTDERNRY